MQLKDQHLAHFMHKNAADDHSMTYSYLSVKVIIQISQDLSHNKPLRLPIADQYKQNIIRAYHSTKVIVEDPSENYPGLNNSISKKNN